MRKKENIQLQSKIAFKGYNSVRWKYVLMVATCSKALACQAYLSRTVRNWAFLKTY